MSIECGLRDVEVDGSQKFVRIILPKNVTGRIVPSESTEHTLFSGYPDPLEFSSSDEKYQCVIVPIDQITLMKFFDNLFNTKDENGAMCEFPNYVTLVGLLQKD